MVKFVDCRPNSARTAVPSTVTPPKLAPHILQMRENLAAAIGCAVEQVSVKATTEEGLGFTGSKQGIAAHCVCLLERI